MDGSITITTKDIPEFLNEAGGHRIQRVPPTERRGRVHTSTVTVSILLTAEVREDCPYAKRSDDDFHIRFFSGTGCGGQHRNKHQNSVVMTHVPTGLQQTAVSRSKQNNIDDARERLEALLDAQAASQAHSQVNASRKYQIGLGMRGDKRRTYRFQDDTVLDHATGRKTTCRKIMRGKLEELWS